MKSLNLLILHLFSSCRHLLSSHHPWCCTQVWGGSVSTLRWAVDDGGDLEKEQTWEQIQNPPLISCVKVNLGGSFLFCSLFFSSHRRCETCQTLAPSCVQVFYFYHISTNLSTATFYSPTRRLAVARIKKSLMMPRMRLFIEFSIFYLNFNFHSLCRSIKLKISTSWVKMDFSRFFSIKVWSGARWNSCGTLDCKSTFTTCGMWSTL